MTSVTSISPTEPLRAPLTRLPSLTGLRWVAAFLVFGFHVGTLNLIQPRGAHRAWDSVFGLGASGVSFFFILSGFVLVWSARPTDTKRAFWQRRIAKIYPNHAVTWLAIIVLMVVWGDHIGNSYALANLLLLQTWTPAGGYAYSVNSVSWSLSCEAFFYLCLPFALPLLRRIPTKGLYAMILALPVVIYLIDGPISQAFLSPAGAWWFTQLFPPVRSLEFWLGVAAGVLTTRKQWYGPGLWVSSLLFIGIYVANTLWIPGVYWLSDMSIFFLLLIAGAAKTDLTGSFSPWRWPVLVWLGEVSFAFYLVHVGLMENVLRLLQRNGRGWSTLHAPVVIGAFLAAAIFLSWLLFQFVEKPMMKVLGPRRRPRPAPAPAIPAQAGPPASAEEAGSASAGSGADQAVRVRR
jgi:peptidoglycan/LPS O-acetylase OafA/YrhL